MRLSNFPLLFLFVLALFAAVPSAQAQGVRIFAATNLEVGGGFGQRLSNNTVLGLFDDGQLSIATNGIITGRITERLFPNNQWRSTPQNYNIRAKFGSSVAPNNISITTNTYSYVSTNFYYSNQAQRTFRSVTTNELTVRSHRSDFVINVGAAYVIKGRAVADVETSVSIDSDGRLTNTQKDINLGGAIFKQDGQFVGPFNASSVVPQ
jgi:hypothetical protein